ncbi:MAG: hypothetical protein JNL88_10805, partial [Bacteroidia bacterium]|nr:hypothetical protein [Bacteroidia bacterium]
MKKLLSLSIVFIFHLFFCPFVAAQSYTSPGVGVLSSVPEPNGPVRLIFRDTASSTMYVSGDFTAVGGINHSQGAFIDNATGIPKSNFPKIEGTVNTSIPDGKGGWYLGGQFTRVGDKERIDLAQVDSSGNVTDFFDGMKTDGEIMALCKNNSTLFIGGKFGSVGRSASKHADVLMAYTGGSVLNLEGFNGPVYCASSDSAGGWYVGGFFTQAGGKPRTHLAHILADGSISDWAPFVNDTVYAILYDGYYVWAGGALNFYYNLSQIVYSGAKPEGLVCIDKTTGYVSASGYRVHGTVRCLYLAPDDYPGMRFREIFVGGNFYAQADGSWSMHPHLFSFGSKSPVSWVPFTKSYYPLVDTDIPASSSDRAIYTIYIHPNHPNLVFVGGNFTADYGLKKNLLLINRSGTGQSTWTPNPDGPVYSISSYPTDPMFPNFNVYFGGGFTALGGQTNSTYATAIGRNRLFAIHGNTLTLDSIWKPNANGTVRSISFMKDNNGQFSVFLGGDFKEINNVERKQLAQLDTYGNLSSFNPDPDSTVYVVVQAKDQVFVGGLFLHLNSFTQSRRNLASIDLISGQVTSWNPGTSAGADIEYFLPWYTYPLIFRQLIRRYNHYVSGLCISGNSLFAGGCFDSAGGHNRKNLAKINAFNGQANAWNPSPDSIISTLRLSGDRLYVCGRFSVIGAANRKGIAAIDTGSGTVHSWYPGNGTVDFRSRIHSLAVYNNKIIMGGNFTISPALKSLVSADMSTGLFSNPIPGFQTHPKAIEVSGNYLYVAGRIKASQDSSEGINRLARFNLSTGTPDSWVTVCNGDVATITPVGNSAFAGGSFSSLGGTQRQHAFALNPATGDLLSWNPSPDTPPISLLSHNGLIYAGGNFRTIGGKIRHGIAALDPFTGSATNWNPGDSGTISVNGLEAFGDTLYAGGEFVSIGGNLRQNLAGIGISTGLSTAWNPQPNNTISSLARLNQFLYAAGEFYAIGLSLRAGFAQFNLLNNSLTSWEYVSVSDWINTGKLTQKVKKTSADGLAMIRSYINRELVQSTYVSNFTVRVSGSSEYRLTNFQADPSGIHNSLIHDISIHSDTVAIGGERSKVNSTYVYAGSNPLGLSSNDNQNLITTGINMDNDANDAVHSLLYFGDTLYIAGAFDRINGIERAFLAGLVNITITDSCQWRPEGPVLSALGTYCYGDSLELRPTPYSGIYNYEWRGPNGFYSTLAKPKIYNYNDSNAGQYTCRLKVSSSACWS